MSNITITICYGGETLDIPTTSNIVLQDLLQQLADQGRLPAGKDWDVTKKGNSAALSLGDTLEANKIVDGDILTVGLHNSAG